MKRTFALILAGLLMLSMTACTSEPAESSSAPEESSSVSSQPEEGSSSSLEVVDEEKEDAEGEDVSNLDTSSTPEQPTEPAQGSQPPAEVTPPAEQQPAESKPKPKPEKETPVKVEQEPEPEPVQQQTPPAQTQQPPTPVASAQDDGEWTQEMVDDVVEAYRTAALERGWTEDTDLNVALTTGGAWGNPINTSWAIYENEMRSDWIEEYLYGREFDVGKEPEDMYFHVVSEDHGDYWEIYFIFAYSMK